jgi:hypothetical protein
MLVGTASAFGAVVKLPGIRRHFAAEAPILEPDFVAWVRATSGFSEWHGGAIERQPARRET